MPRRIVLAVAYSLASACAAQGPTPESDLPPALSVVKVGASRGPSRVPAATRQGTFVPPQAISAVDVTDDGRFIAVTTLAFRHDRNFWLLSLDGQILWGRYLLPWAPFQVAALDGGQAFGAGIAYSRVTAPHPTVSLFQGPEDAETPLVDAFGAWGWLRYGSGEWKTGWPASLLGDLVVRAGGAVATVRGNDGARRLLREGRREAFPLRHERPYRMAPSADGRSIAFGYILPDREAASAGTKPLLPPVRGLVAVVDAPTASDRWGFAPSGEAAPALEIPRPEEDFPALAAAFNVRADDLVPFRVAASVSPSADGSTVAAAEYAGRLWVRGKPAIGKWDPPYRVIPLVPRQRGRLRILGAPGRELARAEFPREGLYEVHLERETVWCVPTAWFARGMAGSAWLPADEDARSVFAFDVLRGNWTKAWEFPDAVGDFALHPGGGRAWVSCWDGRLYLVRADGREPVEVDVGAPARLRWSRDGSFAVAGTHDGEVLCLGAEGEVRWRRKLPAAEAPPSPGPLKPVFEGLPVFSVGRVGPEHAYVGDMWLVKTAEGGFLVDAGGASSLPATLQRIRAAGVDPAEVRWLLHSHSHGDHSGAGYLWRAMGLRVVAPETAALTLGWLMPTLTDYGVWVPRPVDVPLPLKRAGDESEFRAGGVRVRSVFVPGHSFDSAVYLLELGGKRVAFTGDMGFATQDILHRCWGDAEKAAAVTDVVRTKLIPFKPDFVFTGHSSHRDGTAFLEGLAERSEESIRKARPR